MRTARRNIVGKVLAIAAVAAIAGFVIAGCGGGDNKDSTTPAATNTTTTSTTDTTPSSGGGTKLTLSADPGGALKFDRDTLTANAGKVTIDMDNPSSSGIPHAVAVEGNGVDKDGKTVDPGGHSVVSVDLKPGKYEFYCPVPGHKAAGMEGTLTVQ
jgi:uncharacterized cupredoxin-like copper-binding protein